MVAWLHGFGDGDGDGDGMDGVQLEWKWKWKIGNGKSWRVEGEDSATCMYAGGE